MHHFKNKMIVEFSFNKLFNEVADLVAQLVEQYTFNVWVLGSNPSQVTDLLFRSKFFSY